MSPRIRTLLLTSSALLALGTVPGAAGPDGPVVVGGAASVSGAGTSSVIINQNSDRAIINWTTFNLGTGESARFNQPNSSSIVLNRVTGGLGASSIDGTLSANGRVFIINRDGILFGKNATINTASFLATTHDIRNDDFMAGRMNFNIPGRADASIVNLGRITAETGGFAALVAPGVRNSGTITANLGTVALASGNMFTLDMYGDHLIQLGVNDAIASQVIDVQTGKTLKSLVSNEGKLKANGGRVELTAVQARAVVDSVINTKGVIEANSVGMRNGKIVLGGATASSKSEGAPRQVVKVSGKISVAGRKKDTTGGTVLITGEDIQFANAVINASGRAGGGKVMIGGDWGGGNPDRSLVNNQSAALEPYAIDHASTVSVDAATRINASARDSGNGGKVILWSDVATTFAGVIEAKGAAGAPGGFIETSGKTVNATGTIVAGPGGLWLLDPDDLIIGAPQAATISATLQGGTDVLQQTTASGTSGVGDITVNAQILWSSSATLTLSAYKDIVLPFIASTANIKNTGGGNLILHADNSGTGTGTVRMSGGTDATRVDWSSSSGKVTVFYNPTAFPTQDNLTTGNGRIQLSSQSQITQYMLVNSARNLQDISTNLAGTYALGKNIDFTGFGTFNPIGNNSSFNNSTRFTGILEGQGFAVQNLSVSSTASLVGMFGYIASSGVVRNLNFENAHITATAAGGAQTLGVLAGQNDGSIVNVGTLGANNVVDGGTHVVINAGGLIGLNNGTIAGVVGTGTDVNVAVTIGSGDLSNHFNYAGGLAGINTGTITDMRAGGNVTSGNNSFAGGLVGQNGSTGQAGAGNTASIHNSSASGTVTSDYTAGGLAGVNFIKSDGSTTATIDNSHATGNVVLNAGGFSAGGLVGQNEDRIQSSYYYSGTVTAVGSDNTNANVGGLVGTSSTFALGHVALITDSYSTGTVTAGANTWAGGLVGQNGTGGIASITNSYASGNVTVTGLSSAAGGLVGNNGPGSTITDSQAFGKIAATANGFNNQHFTDAGGLVGDNAGTIQSTTMPGALSSCTAGASFSCASGNVSIGAHGTGGGLVGFNQGTIAMSFATGAVFGLGGVADGNTNLGGLAGTNQGTIVQSHAIGLVGNANANNINAGGLVGDNSGLIVASFATGNVVVGSSGEAGGLVGDNSSNDQFINQGTGANNSATIINSFAMGSVTVGPGSAAGGLAGTNGGALINTGASGAVTGGGDSVLGGLVGVHGLDGGFISASHASGNVTGLGGNSVVGGLIGLNAGTINAASFSSTATGNVQGASESFIGGIVGFNLGRIEGVHATDTSTVIAAGVFSAVGGLAGANAGTIESSSSARNVVGGLNAAAGGLVGLNIALVNVPAGISIPGSAFPVGTISNSSASGNVSGGDTSLVGGLVGINGGTITNSTASGAATGGAVSVVGGLVGLNSGPVDAPNLPAVLTQCDNGFCNTLADVQVSSAPGTITHSSSTGAANGGLASFVGGLAGINFGSIALSYASGNVTGGDGAVVGGFAGFNVGNINQTYATGAVTGGSTSIVGAFVGINAAISVPGFGNLSGTISESYALGATTSGPNSITAAFAAVNLGSLNQVYGAGLVTPGAGGTTGGLVALNRPNFTLSTAVSDLSGLATLTGTGTATHSYWDRQTTGQEISAGGTAMDSAVLAGGTLPAGFDPSIWTHGSYPHLINLGTQHTEPGTPVLPPSTPIPGPTPTPEPGPGPTPEPEPGPVVDQPQPTLTTVSQAQVINQLTNQVTFSVAATTDPLVIPPPLPQPPQSQAQPQGQRQAQPGQQTPAGQVAPMPGQIDAGPGRLFVLPLNETRIVANEVVLQLPCNVSPQALSDVTRENRLSVASSQCLGGSGLAVYRMQIGSGQTIASVIRALVAHRIVAVAQANYTYVLAQEQTPASEQGPTPAGQDDPNLSGRSREGDAAQYVLDKLHLAEIHRMVKGTNIKIAVIDSQIDANHPDIKDNIVARYDATGAEEKPHPHGTGMAGAIVSHQKLMGIAPDAQIAAIHAFGSSASAESTTFNILKGLDWAANNGVRIINMSFAGPRDPSLERAIKVAHDKGIVLIGAAGNAGPRSPPLYPAADPNVIAVTATDIDDKLFRGANRGSYISIAAPGVDILVPAPDNAYQMTTGTSVATANISGVVALLLERNPQLKPDDIRKILMASAKRLGPNNEFGAGLVDPVKALELAAPRSAAVPAATTGP